MLRVLVLLMVVVSLAGCSGGSGSQGSDAGPSSSASSDVGAGSASVARAGSSNPGSAAKVAASAPAGAQGPTDGSGNPARPKVTASFAQPVVTNKWWSSLIWQTYAGNPYSENLYAHPLAFHASGDGLGVSYPTAVSVDATSYHYPYREDLRVGVPALAAPDARVHRYSDWTVTASIDDGTRGMLATIGHGLPYAYFEVRGGGAQIRCASTPTVVSNQGEVLAVTVGGHTYGLYAPTGSTWTVSGTSLSSSLSGQGWFSLAALPDASPATVEYYRQHAYAWVDGSTVSWVYDEAAGMLTTRYTTHLTIKEAGHADRPLLALYRHQWTHGDTAPTAYTYVSPRGTMRVIEASSFTTRLPFTGVLPSLPDMAVLDKAKLYAMVDSVYQEQLKGPLPTSDTYWTGKALGRLAQLVPVAEQAGHARARDLFLQRIQEKLDDFFDGVAPNVFAYNAQWNSLIGYPASYGSDTSLNDHHFHYGYFLMAAATLARYRPAWASANADTVRELIGDVANADRTSTRYPFLRFFDAFAGHCWASGSQPFASGNNQESSSESIDFSSALVLWGAATGDRALRDEGIFLYANEVEAIHQYWFDVDRQVFPSGFAPPTLGMVWSEGGAYATWWTAEVDEIHGINFLPWQPGALHLGQRPDYVQRNYDYMVAKKGGPEVEWRDIIWSFLVFAQPDTAKSRFLAQLGYAPEGGESVAHTYHWLWSVAALGTPSTSVTASVPTFGVFDRAGVRTYVAYNFGGTAQSVSFSDGATMTVGPFGMAVQAGLVTTPSPTPVASPSPTPVASPSPTPVPSPSPTPVASPSPTPVASPSPAAGASTLYARHGGALSPMQGTAAQTDTVPSAAGRNYDGTPSQPQVYVARGLTGTWRSGQVTAFRAFVDAGRNVGDGPQVRVSYDFDGDGAWDRVETYAYFATNDLPGFERYDQSRGLRSASGAWADLRNGAVRLEVWNAIGTTTTALRTDATATEGQQSLLSIPFDFGAAPTPTPTPTPVASPTPGTSLGTNQLYLRHDGSLSPTALSTSQVDFVASAGGVNHDGTPTQPTTYLLRGVSGRWRSDLSTRFRVLADAGAHVADGVQVRVSYDFTGDGTWDRIETWRYYALNDLVGWEAYTDAVGLSSASGTLRDLVSGTVKVEVWAAIGRDPISVQSDAASYVVLPFDL